MKLFVLFLLFASNFCFAQEKSLLVEYEIIGETGNNKAKLHMSDTFSNWTVSNKNLDNEAFFYKKTSLNLAYGQERFANLKFYVLDTLNNFNWNLTNDTLTILGYKCNSATTIFRGRHYKVFYTSNLNYSDGPWKFCGLPGLILKAKSLDNFIEWTAVSLEYSFKKIDYDKEIFNKQFLNWNNFVAKYKEAVQKFIKIARSNGSLSSDSQAALKIQSVELFYPELQTGEGIKF